MKKPAEPAKAEPKPEKPGIITDRQDVRVYSRPDMMLKSVTGFMKPNTKYYIKGTTSNPYGSFYKLENGQFVAKSSPVTIA